MMVMALGLFLTAPIVAADSPVAQDSSPPPKAPAAPPAGGEAPVDLDRLLQLPDSFDPGSDTKGGANAAEWRVRFTEGRGEIEAAEAALKDAKEELQKMAGDSGSYQVTAPGSTNGENSPVSFKLRQEIRRQTEELDRAQRALRDLEVEANLAGVPQAWRE